MSDVLHLARPEIRALEAYQHAPWEPSLERLHANENPWRIDGDTTRAGLNRYPEPYAFEVERALASLYGVAPEQVLAGRGSDEAIDLLTRGFCAAGHDAVLQCPPTFGMYKVAARIQGAEVIERPLLRARGWAIDPAAILAAMTPRVKLVYVCTPNNPTGNDTDAATLLPLAKQLSGRALLVVDEAYVEFAARPSLANHLAEHDNLVVLRTLSKAYALAGARCGALLAAPSIVELLRKMIQPYALPTPTQEAVLAALQPANLTEARARIARIIEERDRLALALAPLVTRVWPSAANFVLVESAEPARLVAKGRAAGFLLRDFEKTIPGALRITVGSPEQNARLIVGLERA
ncbi:MAG: histidinol-phosphate transaminase [Polyangia bacterium]